MKPVRGHYWAGASERRKGDAMDDTDSLIEFRRKVRLQQRHADPIRPGYEQIVPKIAMVVGTWYVDECGNPTREIKARD
jgi:hypothetical protein